ncbi:uncharacterized protein CDAR_67521 [Caerostris darwini]|uniref:Odorant receptor n=1 Tax=Caerostris darwini TaxID=1538125 RepID=A0AAV4U8H3_9ARAC|nr:uncharacterized protein CDAR_67521 [Caerostris darwini]
MLQSKMDSRNELEEEIYEIFKPLFTLFYALGIHAETERNGRGNFFQKIHSLYFFSFVAINLIHEIFLVNLVTEAEWFKIVFSHALIQVLGTVQALMLYRKRSTLSHVVLQLENALRPLKPFLELNRRNAARKKVIAAILILAVFHFGISSIYARIDIFLMRGTKLPLEYAFNMDVTSKTTEIIVHYTTLCRQMNFIWMDSFLLYYCLVCRILSSAFLRCRDVLNERVACSHFLYLHNSVAKAVFAVDDAYSPQIFTCCSLQLITLFLQVFLLRNISHVGIFYYYLFSGWISMTFLITGIFAFSVAESASKVKESVYFMRFNVHFESWSEMFFKIMMMEVRLTMWKVIDIRRITILSVLGAFFTYTVIIMSL